MSGQVISGALLFLGDYYGTLAAARCLGDRGIDVALADESPWARTRASKHVRSFHKAPPLHDATRFMDWLCAGPAALRGRVLFPASDELVFLFAKYQDALREHYALFMPPFETIYRILNKQRLYEACARTGVSFPRTWFPRGEAELRALLAEIQIEVIIKPKTQIQLRTGAKAAEIPRGGDLVASFTSFVKENPYGPELVTYDADVVWPMVQAYHRSAATSIYSLAGFVDGSGRPPLVRASRKVLQRPRKLGIGLCFEGTTVRPDLVDKVGALCKDLGYVGMFEIEFIEHEDDFLLIDFNPRGYSQMAFEVARGLPLPYLNYLGALGDEAGLADGHRLASAWSPRGKEAYCHELLLSFVIAGQSASAVLGRERSEHWDSWVRERRGQLTDAVRSPGDLGPVLLDAARHGRELLRHPRSFLRSFTR
jgi:predicted ATP-grasp superfamily ATP-dependent carboligase